MPFQKCIVCIMEIILFFCFVTKVWFGWQRVPNAFTLLQGQVCRGNADMRCDRPREGIPAVIHWEFLCLTPSGANGQVEALGKMLRKFCLFLQKF